MITIKVKNARQIIRQEKSWLISKIAPFFVDIERKIEEQIVAEIQKALHDRNIEAEIQIVKEAGHPTTRWIDKSTTAKQDENQELRPSQFQDDNDPEDKR